VTEARPAFYALSPGGWRDYVTLLHPPYTAWHLSYVAIGACLAPALDEGRLGAAAAAFFLGLGVSAHALDELKGRPLATRIPRRVLVALTVVPLAAAVAIGIAGAISFNLWLLLFVAT
jgi:MFS family permease